MNFSMRFFGGRSYSFRKCSNPSTIHHVGSLVFLAIGWKMLSMSRFIA